MRTHLTRRDVLKLGGVAACAALAGRPDLLRAAAGWKKIPIGVQLWCVRKQLATDISGVLGALAAAGFDGVELENAFKTPGPEWRKHLDSAKLKACGFHHTLAELQGEKLAATVEFNQAIGNAYLIIRSLPADVYTSADLLKKTADAVNEAAAKVKPHGMRVGYHNHFADFNRIGGEYWWNLFADATTKDVVLQLDTGNAAELPGVPLADLVRRNAGRTVTMHIKPYSKANPNAYIGADELDWPAIMAAAESVGGLDWYIVEYEREGTPPVEALKANLDGFRKLRG
ncbi:MAG TPA: TIM barrel protein [Vicinamibacterales bacterium]|nr:TIM barrel protein [Vicinamibacterales bacterium]HPW21559.1 TIM barrel protein [Vicinamibacterales bacterium]